MKPPSKNVYWAAIGVVSRIGDELIVEADFCRGGKSVAVIGLDDLLRPVMRQFRTIEAGVSLGGKCWKRPDDTIGIAGVINGISNAHMEYFNAGSSCERTSKSQSAYCKRDGRLPAPSALEPLLSRATRTDSSNSNRRSLED